MSIRFQKNQTVVDLPDPVPGGPMAAVRRQALGRTAGGTVYVYEKGTRTYEAELTVESLDDAQKSALDGFFDATAQGALQTFTYVDSGGVSRTARFLQSKLVFTKVAANVWDVRLRLELSGMGS